MLRLRRSQIPQLRAIYCCGWETLDLELCRNILKFTYLISVHLDMAHALAETLTSTQHKARTRQGCDGVWQSSSREEHVQTRHVSTICGHSTHVGDMEAAGSSGGFPVTLRDDANRIIAHGMASLPITAKRRRDCVWDWGARHGSATIVLKHSKTVRIPYSKPQSRRDAYRRLHCAGDAR